jgi:phosphoglycolate phosphatase
MIKLPEAVIFDWDNTLVDSLPIVEQAREIAFEKFKNYSKNEAVLGNINSPKSLFFMQFGDRADEAIQFFLSEYKKLSATGIEPFDGAHETLETISSLNIPMMIVSNKINTLLNQEVELLNWNKYFCRIVGSQDTPEDKPHSSPVYLALDSVNLSPSKDVWLIGDSTIDVKCAFNSGCHPILFGDKEEFDPEEFKNIEIDHVTTHKELKNLFNSIKQY